MAIYSDMYITFMTDLIVIPHVDFVSLTLDYHCLTPAEREDSLSSRDWGHHVQDGKYNTAV
eukprot:scaffold165419_cov54-Attheya_sp.AAC.4